MGKKEMLVSAIENGTVIDHIPAEKTYQVVDLLGLRGSSTPVTIGYNLPSEKIGKKGIIKITDKFFSDEEISRLSVVAPKIVVKNRNKGKVRMRKKTIGEVLKLARTNQGLSLEELSSVTIRNASPTMNRC